MDRIALHYAKNLISRKSSVTQQTLEFVMLVDNLAHEKRVDVKWAGEDGIWHTQPAAYHSSVDQHREYWVAHLAFALVPQQSLPGNVRFALRYRVSGSDYWDNNQGRNHCIEADSGILAGHGKTVLNTRLATILAAGEKRLPVAVAVDKALHAERVTVHWSTDNWLTRHHTPCSFARDYWDKESLSNARNPNQYGVAMWTATLPVDHAFRAHYKFSCQTRQGVVGDDNFGHAYVTERPPLRVLILNLHCYQEENQDFKLSQIARAIDELAVDIVCLQEVAELWNDGQGDWQSNSARIINERLESPYHLVSDWSHLGFERYREGVAVLSRHPIEKSAANYVSDSHDPYSIHSRKVVMAQIRVPYVGLVNVFSSHLSWWDDGFPEQFARLRHWAADEHSARTAATLLCGDFNIKAGSRGYRRVLEANDYDDQYLAANSPQLARELAEGGRSAAQLLARDHRIDYIFLRRGSRLGVTSGRTVFTDHDYGRVSDHCGYLMTFVPS